MQMRSGAGAQAGVPLRNEPTRWAAATKPRTDAYTATMRRTGVASHEAVAAGEPAADGSVAIASVDTAPVRVQGLATGRVYEFSGLQRVQPVDARDAQAMLNTRFFRRA